MFWSIGIILVILWLLGVLTDYTMGGGINILLVIGVTVLMARLTHIPGRKTS